MVNVLKAMGIQQWQRRPEKVAVDSHMPAIADEDKTFKSNLDQRASEDVLVNEFSLSTDIETGFSSPINNTQVDNAPFGGLENASVINTSPTREFSGSLRQALEQSKPGSNKPRTQELPQPKRTEPVKKENTESVIKEAVSQDTDSVSQPVKKRVVPIKLSALLGAETASALESKSSVVDVAPAQSFEPNELNAPPIDDSMIPSLDDFDAQFSIEPPVFNGGGLSWDSLEERIKTNVHCPSCGWGNAFLGSGNQQAQWVFVVDAPTKREMQAKTMFAGRAGQLFEAMLLAIGLDRESVYCTSVFKCAPTEDLSLTPQCDVMVRQQIELVAPKCVVTFGEFAAQSVIKSNLSLTNLRDNDQLCRGLNIPVVPTYSPSEILTNTSLKSLVWQDLKKSLRLTSD